jgi:hypothetical protein
MQGATYHFDKFDSLQRGFCNELPPTIIRTPNESQNTAEAILY